ncbi:hypothetical protein JTE90_023874 [Oedothorax gibbosus]|uniref:Ras-related protein Rab-26 n=1 Tax=Oedothorax gibbosus TaxID=931172 RepID=A0AAV6UNT2_9ARAC|nr:hypothetical protein JTE90_023874 [Oedothorax gibbosus]
MANYGGMHHDTTLQTLTGTRDALRASFKDLNEYYEPDLEELIHKTILVGDSGVGKTSLLVQFDQGKFHMGSFSATVGIGFTVSNQ